MPLKFSPDRSKDENEILKQIIQGFNSCLVKSNTTLHILDINAGFGCVEALFFNFKHRMSKDNIENLMTLMTEYKTRYAEAMGIKPRIQGSDRESLSFLNGLNELVKNIFDKIMEDINKNELKP